MDNHRTTDTIIESDTSWAFDEVPFGKIEFSFSVPIEVEQKILSSLNSQHIGFSRKGDHLLKSLRKVHDLAGHYRFRDGSDSYFIRITRRKRKNPEAEKKIAQFVSESGINVVIPVADEVSVSWKGQNYSFSILPFIEGRHFNGTQRDLENAVKTIKKLHHVLQKCPLREKVSSCARKTAEQLSKTKDVLSKSLRKKDLSSFHQLSGWVERNENWLSKMTTGFDPYICKKDKAQCVHGELHTGNILFTTDTGEVILTDFEEAPNSWFPPSFELAYFIQRFCMFDGPPKHIFWERVELVKETYGSAIPQLENMMHQICYYPIALILDRCLRYISVAPEGECDKFIQYEQRIPQYFN